MGEKQNPVLEFIAKVIRFLVFRLLLSIKEVTFLILKLKAKNSIIIKNVQGSKMYLNLKDEGISKDLAVDGIREPESTKEVKKILKQGNVAVEIGANIGYYALMESRLVGQEGKIYAIEPSPENMSNLKRNIRLNNCNNIKTYQLAIGDKKGIAKMNISPHSNLSSLIAQKNKKIIGVIDVSVVTLDQFLKNKRYPDFIRMDVEGYEYNIIKGMGNVLKSKRPLKLFIELHPHIMKPAQTIGILKTLMSYGFETRKVIRSITVTEMEVMSRSQFDFSSKTINDLLKDKSIINGKLGAFEIFFER